VKRVVLRAVALTLVATMVALAGGCRKQPAIGEEGRLEPGGNVLLSGRGGDPISITSQRTLRRGDVVEVSDGSASVALPSGATLELRPRTIVVFDKGPELRNGDLLVVAQRGPQVVRAAGSDVRASGATRLTQSLSLRVASYAGKASIESGGRSIDVPALRQVGVPAVGVVPGAPSPLVLAREDPWDKRFLGNVMANIDALESLSRGFTSQAVGGRSVGFYRSLIPALDPQSAFQQAYVDQLREPGEVLLGSMIALLGRRSTFADRLAAAAAFRADGAPWALVALDQDVPSFEVLRNNLATAIDRTVLQLAAAAPPPVTVPAPTTTVKRTTSGRTPATSAPAPTTPSPAPTTAPTTPTTTTPPPAVAPPPTQPPGLLSPIVDPVVNLLNGLLGGGR
jgi:hypothetical protein